jgi:AcrR family transcriptional regulator
MPRSGEKVRRRLQQAALELYRKRGFDQTTTAEIAAKAKVTERTFFRHFADKREVLFDGETTLRAALEQSVRESPDELSPLQTILRALRSIVPIVEKNRPFLEPRAQTIAANPALRERELAKVAALVDTLATALRARRVGDRSATLAAQVGMAAYAHGARAWRDHPSRSLDRLVVQAFDDLEALCSAASAPTKTTHQTKRRS